MDTVAKLMSQLEEFSPRLRVSLSKGGIVVGKNFIIPMDKIEIAEKAQLYIVVHHHEFGASTRLVRCARFPLEEEVVEACGFDFEPDKNEYIDIDPSSEKIVEIK